VKNILIVDCETTGLLETDVCIEVVAPRLSAGLIRLKRSVMERLMEMVEIDDASCWNFMGHRDRHGYGRISFKASGALAHRIAFEFCRGPITTGLELDHLCRNKACCNPAHLEPVDHRTNLLRGDSPTARLARQTNCAAGHDLVPDRYKKGVRYCPVCDLIRRRAKRTQNKEAINAKARAYYAARRQRCAMS
jgi:hypothetical protein